MMGWLKLTYRYAVREHGEGDNIFGQLDSLLALERPQSSIILTARSGLTEGNLGWSWFSENVPMMVVSCFSSAAAIDLS